MSWNLEGQRVTGKYLGEILVTGVVTHSRVCLGNRINHYVNLDEPVMVYGSERDSVILEANNIIQVT